MITGIIIGMIFMWLTKKYTKSKRVKKEREDLVTKMNAWRQEKYFKNYWIGN